MDTAQIWIYRRDNIWIVNVRGILFHCMAARLAFTHMKNRKSNRYETIGIYRNRRRGGGGDHQPPTVLLFCMAVALTVYIIIDILF